MAASLNTAVSQVIRFLTSKLVGKYSPTTIVNLQKALETNLTSHFSSSWYPNDPRRGSALRCLTLSPACLPPTPIWAACTSTNVQWFDWMKMLGDTEFDLFVDPGCVAIRLKAQIFTIWSDDTVPIPAAAVSRVDHSTSAIEAAYRSHITRTTLAQQLSQDDREDEEQLFHLLNDEITAPAWTTPIFAQFPPPARSASPHSRCSSRSSNTSSSGFSHYSGDTASSRTSATSASPKSTASPTGQYKQSRRERARQARVFVDTSKKEVTPYDGGKTTVLTGGVMLGGAPKVTATSKPKRMATPDNAMSNSNSRRSVRA